MDVGTVQIAGILTRREAGQGVTGEERDIHSRLGHQSPGRIQCPGFDAARDMTEAGAGDGNFHGVCSAASLRCLRTSAALS